ncbi:hypothetical protein Leryth_014521 [Lithospermum erythrorhizon]|nr:hypothetical protein Leryth_014521 [Lithospermum erythrorhizon]
MEEPTMSETRLTSAAAFVEGGVQDACDDSCSICLEEFCESDPATVTGCKHEYHLQCILEWCQRSSQCPMCLQPISLKDPSSQELLDAIEHERNMRINQPRSTAIFHHPTLGDFELQHLPVNATDSELEERIIQHLAAAAAMGGTRHLVRREGQRGRPSSQGRHFLVFSNHPSATSSAAVSPPEQRSGGGPAPPVILGGSDFPLVTAGEDTGQMITPQTPVQANQFEASALGSSSDSRSHGTPSSRRSPTRSSPSSQDSVGTSDLQSLSESLKTRFSAMSTRYKESITKSTRGWRERLFARNTSTPESRVQVRREADAGAATIANMMERLGTAEDNRTSMAPETDISSVGSSPPSLTDQHSAASICGDQYHRSSTDENPQPPCTASSASS